MQKHAYLIIAHNQFSLLEMLIKLLDYEKHDIYIHIDKKVKDFDFEYFRNLVKKSNVYFIKRYSVTWGGYSQIKVEIALLRAAVRKQYAYYHLLSGVDLPLKKAPEIYSFFESNNDKQFVHFSEVKDSIRNRVKYYWLFQERTGNVIDTKLKKLFYTLEGKSMDLQKKLRTDRLNKWESELYFGANWFSITHDLALYVTNNRKWIKRHFRFSRCADELFLQSLMMKSVTGWELYSAPKGSYLSCMRSIDWERGDPYVYRKEDYEDLIHSDYMFARKFNMSVDGEICQMIYQHVMPETGAECEK